MTTSSSLSLPPWPRTRRYEVDATVIAHRQIVGHEFEIVFHAPVIARSARAGQFVEILFGDNYAPLVRRPFSLYRVDPDAGTFSVLYLARGAFTSGLARKREGDVVSLLGPLGRPFHWTDAPDVQHVLIAGGLGAPPLYFLASELCRSFADSSGQTSRSKDGGQVRDTTIRTRPDRTGMSQAAQHETKERRDRELLESLSGAADSRLIVINAARTESLLVGITEFGELEVRLHVMTDDGSRGVRGMATELLEVLLVAEPDTPKALYACGPMPMLRSVGEIAIARGLPCQLSIETSMPCGIGLCQGCAISVHDPSSPTGCSYVLSCVEGPVFEARDLIW